MYETVIAIIVAFACGFLLGKYDLFGKSKRKENISKSSNVLNANQSNTETASVANTPKLRLKRKAKVESQNGAADISPAPASVEMVVASGGTVDSPVNDSLNNRVRAGSESHDATLRPLIDNATILLLDIIGVKRSASSNYGKRPWELVRTGPSSHFWLSSSKVDGVLLRGTSIAVSDAKDVLYFLSRQSECIGMESIADTYEVLYVSEDKKTTLYRIRCKTNSITSWVRDFVIINNVVEKPDGTVIMVSQSLPDDYVTMLCGPKSLRSNKRSVRGILYCSGYVLRPLKSGEGNGCEVSYGCHIDFKGSKGLNTKKMDALMCHMQVIMEQLQQGVVDHTRASPMDLDLGLGPSNNPTSPKLKSKNHSKHNPPHQHQLAAAAAASSSLNSQLTQGPSRDHDKETRSESKPEEETCTSQYDMNIDEDQRLELLSASKHAMSRLRNLNTSVTEIGTHNTGWDTFFESDGVSVSENSNADGEPGGPIEARCTIDVSMFVIKIVIFCHL